MMGVPRRVNRPFAGSPADRVQATVLEWRQCLYCDESFWRPFDTDNATARRRACLMCLLAANTTNPPFFAPELRGLLDDRWLFSLDADLRPTRVQ